eukprot:GHVU01012748.1.p1 GENE.GHVU01012748.1~~GHVU01012748.1.p1  ORF type:complete len:1670 (-),score=111.61 GHVU01012748.1:639-5648(-)
MPVTGVGAPGADAPVARGRSRGRPRGNNATVRGRGGRGRPRGSRVGIGTASGGVPATVSPFTRSFAATSGVSRGSRGHPPAATTDCGFNMAAWGLQAAIPTMELTPVRPSQEAPVHAEIRQAAEGVIPLIATTHPRYRLALTTTDGIFSGRLRVEAHRLGPRTPCPHCNAMLLEEEKQRGRICCGKGKVRLPLWEMPPLIPSPGDGDANEEPLRVQQLRAQRAILDLWQRDDASGRLFRNHGRAFNCALTLVRRSTSRRNEDLNPIIGHRPAFAVSGRLYHKLPALQGMQGDETMSARLYIRDARFDSATPGSQQQRRLQAIDSRLAIMQPHIRSLSSAALLRIRLLLDFLEEQLRLASPYVRDFQHVCRIPADSLDLGTLVIGAQPFAHIRNVPLRRDAPEHLQPSLPRWQLQRYQAVAPFDEIAVLIENEPRCTMDLPLTVQAERAQQWTGIRYCHRSFDPLHFVLLFPGGEDGWWRGIPYVRPSETREQSTVTIREWYAYHLHSRAGERDCLLRAGRVFQEWCCMAFAKIDGERLDYIRQPHMQQMFRSDILSNVVDSIRRRDAGGEHGGRDAGRTTAVPNAHASSTAGPQPAAGSTADAAQQAADEGTSSCGSVEGEGPAQVGKQYILPGTHVGSIRDVTARFHRAMAMTMKKGAPRVLVTMTMNRNWPELKEAMIKDPNTQEPIGVVQDRPDLIARVFQAKKRRLLEMVTKEGVFGTCIGFCWSQEYQKKGLPHIHLLVVLHPDDDIDESNIDNLVRAEIPPEGPLRDIVLNQMVHGDCANDPNQPCLVAGKCRHHFPKPFEPQSRVDSRRARVFYRRRPEAAVHHNGRIVRNCDIVPYNPLLLLDLQCHINVEFVASAGGGVAYLFKYVYKGEDKTIAGLRVDDNPDEISSYESMRYLASPECCAKIYGFEHYGLAPTVYTLQVHLEGEQSCFYHPDNVQAAIDRHSRTMLTEWFKWNRDNCGRGGNRPGIKYADFPDHFTWDDGKREWRPRERGRQFPTIGRIASVHPSAGDRYYLRILLNHVHSIGAPSFEELKRVGDIVCSTYREVCLTLGLLEGDREQREALTLAAHADTAAALRRLFVMYLIHNRPPSVEGLLNDFARQLGNDYIRHGVENDDEVYLLVLWELEVILDQNGKRPHDVGLPLLDAAQRNTVAATRQRLIQDSHIEDVATYGDALIDARLNSLNTLQTQFVTSVMTALDSRDFNRPRCMFLDAPAGTGKTYCFNLLLDMCHARGYKAIVVATSGVAAALLASHDRKVRGRTFHSQFRAPLKAAEARDFNIPKQGELAAELRKVDIILWDEAPMAHNILMNKLDDALRDICDSDIPFAGKVVVDAGDFRQTIPIVDRKVENDVSASLFSSTLWPLFQRFKLTENVRLLRGGGTEEIRSYAKWILDVGNGTAEMTPDGETLLPPALCIPCNVDDVVEFVYDGLEDHKGDPEWLAGRAILTPTNDLAWEVNEAVCRKYYADDPTWTLFSADTMAETDGSLYVETEYMNNAKVRGALPPHRLQVCKGMIVMVLWNIDTHNGLCNGTRVIVDDVLGNVTIKGRIVDGTNNNIVVFIPRIKIEADGELLGFKWHRTQFPVRPCFAMTINKSQGQSLGRVGVYLPTPVFSHGQFYVAVSRVTNPSNIRFAVPSSSDTCSTLNVVNLEVLRLAGISDT